MQDPVEKIKLVNTLLDGVMILVKKSLPDHLALVKKYLRTIPGMKKVITQSRLRPKIFMVLNVVAGDRL